MACREGVDPADFESGSGDDSSDPVGSELIVLDTTAEVGNNAFGYCFVDFLVGVDNINFTNDITFQFDTADGTAVSSGANKKFRAIAAQVATIKAGFSNTVVSVPVYVYPPAGGARYTGKYTMTLTISSPTNATILDGTGTGTIDYSLLADGNNPDDAPGLSVVPYGSPVDPQTLVQVQTFLTPASGGTVTVHYATADGTGVAGTDYTSQSGTLTFTAGQTVKSIYIQTLNNPAATTDKTVFFNLSSPSGAVISVASGFITIKYSASGGLPAQFTGWSDGDRVTYDEFRSFGGGGCCFQYACTGFAGAAAMSGLAAVQGKGRWRFNAEKLYSDACCAGCTSASTNCQQCTGGCNPAKVPSWLASNGAQRIDKNVVNGSSDWTCKYQDNSADHATFKAQSTAISAGTKNDLVNKIKQAVFDNGVMYFASIFYGRAATGTEGWNVCNAADGYTLRYYTGNSAAAHAWVIVGWDDNHLIPSGASSTFPASMRGQRVGCFRVQSSHGCNWGESGRGWIPYSYLGLPTAFSGNGPRFKYWKLTWVG